MGCSYDVSWLFIDWCSNAKWFILANLSCVMIHTEDFHVSAGISSTWNLAFRSFTFFRVWFFLAPGCCWRTSGAIKDKVPTHPVMVVDWDPWRVSWKTVLFLWDENTTRKRSEKKESNLPMKNCSIKKHLPEAPSTLCLCDFSSSFLLWNACWSQSRWASILLPLVLQTVHDLRSDSDHARKWWDSVLVFCLPT